MILFAGFPDLDSSPPRPDQCIPSNIGSGERAAQPGLDPAWCILSALYRIAGPHLYGVHGILQCDNQGGRAW